MILAGAALSLLAGITLGLLGGGGSILMVPILVYVLGIPPHEAFPMSLVIIGFTSLISALRANSARRVELRIGLLFGAAGMAGAFGGTRLSTELPPSLLLSIFGGVVVAAALGMIWPPKHPSRAVSSGAEAADNSALPPLSITRLVFSGGVVGLLTGLVGVGGGFLAVPALMFFGGLSLDKAAATSLVVIALNCGAGLLGSSLVGTPIVWSLALAMSACAITGALLGMHFARRLPQELLRAAFGSLILILGASILVRPVLDAWGEAAMAARGPIAVVAGVTISSFVLLVARAWRTRRSPAEPPDSALVDVPVRVSSTPPPGSEIR